MLLDSAASNALPHNNYRLTCLLLGSLWCCVHENQEQTHIWLSVVLSVFKNVSHCLQYYMCWVVNIM